MISAGVCEETTSNETVQEFKPARLALPIAHYDVGRKDYWIEDTAGDWIPLTETSVKRQVRARGYSAKIKEGETMSPLDNWLITVQNQFNVSYAGPLAGYAKGPTEMCGNRILVTSSSKLIQPAPGDFPVLGQFLQTRFGEEQLSYLYGWLKVAYESLRAHRLRPGQVLVLAGERDSGKSLFQNVITEILGGRSAKPYRYMSKATDFNGDLFGAEHLMIEDEAASTDIRIRRSFGASIKDFTVNVVQSCHAKNRPAISLKPFWRGSISVNEEPENLAVLPPLDDSLEDKLILLKVSKGDLPMPTSTLEERDTFWNKLTSELPAFLYFLTQWKIPAELKCARFGVKYYHHPALVEALSALTPETELLALINSCFKEGSLETTGFEGTAQQLQTLLINSPTHSYEAKRLLYWPTASGAYLGRLRKSHPERVIHIHTAKERKWKIMPPKE